MAEKHIIDELGPLQWFAEMLSFFGARRTTELTGYMIMMGATGKDVRSEIVEALVSLGFSKSGVYRALADVRRFVQHLEHKHGKTLSMKEVFAEIAALSSHVRENVVE